MGMEEEVSLDAAGVHVVACVNLVVCSPCEGGVESTERGFTRHMTRCHHLSASQTRVLYGAVEEKLASEPVDEELEQLYKVKVASCGSTRRLPILPGLPLTDVFKCPYCDHFAGCQRTLGRHIRKTDGHRGGIAAEFDVEDVKPVKGQALWKGTKQRFFFPVLGHGPSGPSGSEPRGPEDGAEGAGTDLRALLRNVREGANVAETPDLNGDTRRMNAFAELTRLDVHLQRYQLSWKDAVALASGASGPLERLDTKMAGNVRQSVMVLMRMSRKHLQTPAMQSIKVLRAVSAPGTSTKRAFKVTLEATEHRYSNFCARLFFLIVRIKRLKEAGDSRVNGVQLSESVMSAADAMERVMGDEGFDTQKEEETAAKVIYDLFCAVLYEQASLEEDAPPVTASVFVACIGVCDLKQPRMSEGRDMSPVLAALAYLASCCAVMSIAQWPGLEGKDEALERVSRQHSPDAGLGINVFQEMLSRTTITRHSESARAVYIECEEDGHKNCGWVSGCHLSAATVGDVVRRLHGHLVDVLFGEQGIFGGIELPPDLEERLGRIEDDPMNRSAGFSFLNHPSNQLLIRECGQCVEELVTGLMGVGDEEERERTVRKVLDKVEEAARYLTCCIHLSSGNPGRGTELGLQGVRNTKYSQRQYFVFNQRIASIPGYCKTRSMFRGKLRVVSRHPDLTTSNLFKAFAIFGMEIRAVLRLSLLNCNASDEEKEEAIAKDYLLADPSERSGLCDVMRRIWQQHGLSVGVRDFRQWCGAYCNSKARNDSDMKKALEAMGSWKDEGESGAEEAKNVGNALQLQGAHSIKTAATGYGQYSTGIPVSMRVGMDSMLDQHLVSLFLSASDTWLKDTGLNEKVIHRYRPGRPGRIGRVVQTAGRTDIGRKLDDVGCAKASGPTRLHRVLIGEGNRIRVEEEGKGRSDDASTKGANQSVPIDLHDADNLGDEDGEDAVMEIENPWPRAEGTSANCAAATERDGQSENGEPVVQAETPRTDLLRALRMGVGKKDASFRSTQQEEAMSIVSAGEQDLLYCDRTGGGKSAVIFGPSLTERGVTAYLCPLRSLQQDITARCQQIGLPTRGLEDVRMIPNEPLPNGGILLFSPEQVGEDKYREVIGNLHASGMLKRIVVDEVHIILLSQHYRQCMAKMRQVRLGLKEIQLVMMTATCPPTLTSSVLAAMGCHEREVRIVRGNLRRDNVGVTVRRLPVGDRWVMVEKVAAEVVTAISDLGMGNAGKHLVAVLTRSDADDIGHALIAKAKKIGHSVTIRRYHSGMASEERRESGDAWRDAPVGNGQSFVMVATDGFGVGIDAPDVRTVHIAGCVRTLIDMWQIVGRIGRDGSTGHAYFAFHEDHVGRSCVTDTHARGMLQQVVQWVKNGTDCRLSSIEQYLGSSSVAVSCWERKSSSGKGVELCDTCKTFLGDEMGKRPLQVEATAGKLSNKRVCLATPMGRIAPIRAVQPRRVMKVVDVEERKKCHATMARRQETAVPTTAAIQAMVDCLREDVKKIQGHCVSCLSEAGKAGRKTKKGRNHSWQCGRRRCLRCQATGHMAKDCMTLIRPNARNGKMGCTACFLYTVGGSAYMWERDHRCPAKLSSAVGNVAHSRERLNWR